MTKKLNTGDEVADTCALLGYLHDNTIEQEHLQRMSDTSPIVFDNFMQALDVIKFHTDDCLTNDPWGATPVDPQLVSAAPPFAGGTPEPGRAGAGQCCHPVAVPICLCPRHFSHLSPVFSPSPSPRVPLPQACA